MTASTCIIVGCHVWVEDSEEAWKDGEVVEVQGEEITIKCTSGEKVLSVQQLYRICTLYCDDNYHTPSVSPDVISTMEVLMMEESNDSNSSSFLLDDSSSIPFSVDDISSSIKVKVFSTVKPPAELLEKAAFQFLQE